MTAQQTAVAMVAAARGFHKREDKPAYWAIFDRLAQESEELLDDLRRRATRPGTGKPRILC